MTNSSHVHQAYCEDYSVRVEVSCGYGHRDIVVSKHYNDGYFFFTPQACPEGHRWLVSCGLPNSILARLHRYVDISLTYLRKEV